jgi:hypothetical protein
MKRPVLVLSGKKDQFDAGGRYRTLLSGCQFMFVYDAGRASVDRPRRSASLRSNSSNRAISS